MPHVVLRRAIATIAASLILIISPLHAQDDVRALWVVRTTLTSPIILFSYDSLADPARGPGYLSQVGRAAFQF